LVECVTEADAARLALGFGAGDAVDERTDLGIGAEAGTSHMSCQ
jgi:hypothetical protein